MTETNYRIYIYPIIDDEGNTSWGAEFPELPGCAGGGDTPEEAVEMALDAKNTWINAAEENNEELPEPKNPHVNEYSGKFTLRLPKSLHKELSFAAEEEEMSLNKYIIYLLTKKNTEHKLEEILMEHKQKLQPKIKMQIKHLYNKQEKTSDQDLWKKMRHSLEPIVNEGPRQYVSILRRNKE